MVSEFQRMCTKKEMKLVNSSDIINININLIVMIFAKLMSNIFYLFQVIWYGVIGRGNSNFTIGSVMGYIPALGPIFVNIIHIDALNQHHWCIS